VNGYSRDACHHDRTQTNTRRLGNSGELSQALQLQFISKLHNQDSVLRNEPDQCDQTDLGINVKRRRPAVSKEFSKRHFQESEEKRAKHRQRNGAKQNDKWVAEAVELGRQDKKDQNDRQQKDG